MDGYRAYASSKFGGLRLHNSETEGRSLGRQCDELGFTPVLKLNRKLHEQHDAPASDGEGEEISVTGGAWLVIAIVVPHVLPIVARRLEVEWHVGALKQLVSVQN